MTSIQPIKYTKKVNYYNKKMEIVDTVTSEKSFFTNLNDAITLLANTELHYVENKKGISVFEEIVIQDTTDPYNWKFYRKEINTATKRITTNFNEGSVIDVL